ncbi:MULTISPECIES: murein hydrolase activator EnvC [Micromonospora]|uniref:M23 family metallopeptidase n=1 Tax=Micromonospora solifontis TaxID=2487138 RepID=A0ABX9WLX2_9ACTN|nr:MULTISPECIES: M23 family metallopeptidase [Micromonospora]NES16126.1 M23 family metallopeptidase [Micromonospora sp. PPF5-17B]NES34886.1 M23 family metallopeptidase [Micromonospora solifontis]NES57604.1 M23 family metallopeptidase [Micromonospora sp. PPF5-6]RNM01548.1 M23 family metallopeptidase [Micromonospora solifontis]
MPKLLRSTVPALCVLLLVGPTSAGSAAARSAPAFVGSAPASARPARASAHPASPLAGPASVGARRPVDRLSDANGADRAGVGSSGTPAAGGPAARFDWPLAGPPRPVRPFDPPPQRWLPGHRGVDLAATPGLAVRAAGPGVVLFAGPVAGRPVLTIGHGGGLRTTYEPVRAGLPVGARVATGTPAGTLLAGHPGCPAAACLHWGLRRGDEYLDPLALLGLGRVRLLPLDPAAVAPDPGQPWASSAGRRTASRSYSSGLL